MRNRTRTLTFGVVLVLLILARQHLVDLFESARTYATFHAWTDAESKQLYKFTNEPAKSVENPELAPRILHHIYLAADEDLPARYRPAVQSCLDMNANWTHRLWTTDSAAEFMRSNYPLVYPHYAGYKQTIQRANVLRYALLHHFGGVYLDTDVECLQPLEPLLQLPFLSPGAYPAGVNNAFILARPGHPLLGRILDAVPKHDLTWGLPYVENMLSTGCMFFSNQWTRHVRSIEAAEESSSSAPALSQVFVLADEHGNLDPHMLRGVATTPLFHHGGASSWHSWDAAVIILVGKHYQIATFGVAFILVAGLAHLVIPRRKPELLKAVGTKDDISYQA